MSYWKDAIKEIQAAARTDSPDPREVSWATMHTAMEAIDKQIPKKPKMKADEGFAAEVASSLCCPTCGGPVTNYWVPGARPKHCQFCGQALDWEKGGEN